MKKLLQKWHWIHTWSKWEAEPMKYVSYPWTSPGHYAHKQLDQLRSCKVCGLQQSKTETIL